MLLDAHVLYLLSLWTVVFGWLGFGAIFLLQRKRSEDQAKNIVRASIWGIAIQFIAFAAAWFIGRRPDTPILPLGYWFHCLTALLVIVLVVGSTGMMSAAVHVLGKQWSVQARVLESHALIRNGPYRIVRHPIYAGMFGMLLAAGLAYSHWIGFVIAATLFPIGTAIRVRIEEKLLREQFGAAFEDYVRKVPAVIPLLRRP